MPATHRESVPSKLRIARNGEIVWVTDREGTFTQAFGPGLPCPAEALIGQSVWERYAGCPELLGAFTRAFAGHETPPVFASLPTGSWLVECRPVSVAGEVVAVHGLTRRLEQDVPTPGPRELVWEMRGEHRDEPSYHATDRFFRTQGEPGAMMTRYIPDAELTRLLTEHSRDLELISDSGPVASHYLRLVL